VTPDAQSAALGNTGVANPDSSFSAYHNPSLLSRSQNVFRLAGAQMQWLVGVQASHYALSMTLPSQNETPWGLGVYFSDWRSGAFDGTDALGNATGAVEYNAQNIGFAVSRAVMPGLHLGAGVKQISQSFQEGEGDTKAAVLAYDAGLTYDTPMEGVVFGASLQNFGGKVQFSEQQESLPQTVRAGLQGGFLQKKLQWNVEAVHSNEKTLAVQTGMAFNPFSMISLRAGYDTLTGGESYLGMTTGIGFSFENFSLDYSFVPFNTLGVSQRVSMSWKIGQIPGVRK
jgi:hypothetical protein